MVVKLYSVAKLTGFRDGLIPGSVSGWTVLDGESESFRPKESIHMRILIGMEGRPLTEAAGPRSFVRGILHAMLGTGRQFFCDTASLRDLGKALCAIQERLITPGREHRKCDVNGGRGSRGCERVCTIFSVQIQHLKFSAVSM